MMADLCAVCLDAKELACIETLKCGHMFHRDCIGAWFAHKQQNWKCPMCRTCIAARKFSWNDTYTVLLRVDTEAPWRRVMNSLPQEPAFLELASRVCNTTVLRGLYYYWCFLAPVSVRAQFAKLKSQYGTALFSWDDSKRFKVEFKFGARTTRVPISQLNFFAQAYIHGVFAAYQEAVPTTDAIMPRRQALIEILQETSRVAAAASTLK